jgi:D-serine deaminase-like pyridoxal phosphate-dependent protein
MGGVISAPMVLPAAAAAPPKLSRGDLPTPAMIVELDALESNIRKMASHLKAKGRGFRPHAKTHKCSEIGKMLIRAGAVGACAAKLSEAEALSAGGVGGLLITSAVVGRDKLRRAVDLCRRRPETILCVDDLINARDLDAAARAANVKVNAAIDLWVGRRTGIQPGEPAVQLALEISRLKNLSLKGIQAYAGHSSHAKGFESRVKSSREAMRDAVETRRAIEAEGVRCDWLSGGSTGTWNIDPEIDGVTEHQPGSFLFMDIDYMRIGGQSGEVFDDFKTSLFVISTVISKPKPELAIVDGGFKAFATDRGYGPDVRGRSELTYRFAGDEHGALTSANGDVGVKVGDRLEFIVPHCDPTVNLYDRIYALRGDQVEAAWTIDARGRSQ